MLATSIPTRIFVSKWGYCNNRWDSREPVCGKLNELKVGIVVSCNLSCVVWLSRQTSHVCACSMWSSLGKKCPICRDRIGSTGKVSFLRIELAPIMLIDSWWLLPARDNYHAIFTRTPFYCVLHHDSNASRRGVFSTH